MKVLYIHAVGPWGGSSRSLLESIKNFPDGSIEPCFILAKGSSNQYFDKLSNEIITVNGLTRFDNTEYSYYQRFRWLVLLRELYFFPFTLFAIAKARKKFKKIDLIHINDLVDIIPLFLVKILFNKPTVIHVRCVSRLNQKALRTRVVSWILKKYADAIISIDETTKSSLCYSLNIDVIHNSFTPIYSEKLDKIFNDRISRLEFNKFKVGFVGSLMKGKGIFELLDAANIVINSGYDVLFLYVGGEAPMNKGFIGWLIKKLGLRHYMKDELENKIKEYGLENHVLLLGYTNDVQRAYEKMNVICVPGHYDAPGRQVIEAAFSGVPTILAITKPKPDTLIPFITGLHVPIKDANKLAEAIIYCIKNPIKTKQMGEEAKNLARKNFTPTVNSKKILEVYKRVLTNKNK